MSLTSLQLPPPTAWQAFEALCWDIFTGEWGTRDGYRHGRNGQRQYGVDIVARLPRGWVGVQCKDVALGGELTAATLRSIVTEAQQFQPPLCALTIATTARRDEKVQRVAREITDRHLKNGLFEVTIAWWDELCARLDLQPEIVARHFPTLTRFRAPVSAPSTDFSVRIANFSAQYLGKAGQGAPFGGRDRELADLDVWLQSNTEPYRLMRAGAGRGKSALIVQWLNTLTTSVEVIFMPISVRFRTNLAHVVFPSILTRLTVLHAQATPNVHEFSPEVCRGLIGDLLGRPLPDSTRLLLVIDGLDEAGDFELAADFLPVSPPAGLKVLLSGRPVARGVDPLAVLTSGKIGTLSPLAAADAEHIAIDAGVDPGTTAQIVRLADGDPLLLRHYVEGLVAGEICPESLTATPSGMRGFFDNWWRDQITLWEGLSTAQRDLVEQLVCILSCALTPMLIDDVLQLLGNKERLSILEFDAAISRLARLLVGDGRFEGLAISHPRFADYIREEWMPKAKRTEVEARFIEWGIRALQEVGSDGSHSNKMPPYLIRNLGAHLERSGERAELHFKLTSRAWAECWHTQDPSLAGFLIDVERCRRACVRQLEMETSPAEAAASLIERLVACGLVTTSVVTARETMPPELYVAALKLGYWAPEVVVAHISTIQKSSTRRAAIAEIAGALGRRYGSDLLALALSCSDPRDKAWALTHVYRYLDETDRPIAAAAIAGYARSAKWMILDLAEIDDAEAALAIARELPDPVDRAHTLASVLPILRDSDRDLVEQEVLSLIRANAEVFAEHLVYEGGLAHLRSRARIEAVNLILDAADANDLDARGAIREFAYVGHADIGPRLIRSAQAIADPWDRSNALQAIAPHVSQPDIGAYVAAAGSADAGALAALGAHYPGEWARMALSICEHENYHPSIRAPILVNASRFLDDTERAALAPKILADLKAEVDTRAWDHHDSDWLLADFAATFVPTSSKMAISLVSQIGAAEVRGRVASNFYLRAECRDREAWLGIIRQIDDPLPVIDALCVLANNTTGEVRREFCGNARDHALATGHARWLIRNAVNSAWDLDSELGVVAIKSALQIARFRDGRELAEVVSTLAPGASSRGAETALWIAMHLGHDFLVVPVVSSFATHFSANQIDRILSLVERIVTDTERVPMGAFSGQLLGALFKQMSKSQQTHALDIARRAAAKGDCLPIASCVARLRGARRTRLLSEIDQLIGQLPPEIQMRAREIVEWCVSKRGGVASHKAAASAAEVRAYSLNELTESLQCLRTSLDHAGRVETGRVEALIDMLTRQPRRAVASGLDAALRVMARWHRSEFLSTLGLFRPVISALAGPPGIDAALKAIKENARTWGSPRVSRRPV
jgi:hypothetical protein